MYFLQSPEPPITHKDKEPKRNGTSHVQRNNNLGTKFQDVQRKWMLSPPPMGESDSSDLDPDPCNTTPQSKMLPNLPPISMFEKKRKKFYDLVLNFARFLNGLTAEILFVNRGEKWREIQTG